MTYVVAAVGVPHSPFFHLQAPDHRLDFREAVAADAEQALALASPPLDEGEQRALLAGDVGVLARAGANPFLLCQLGRLGMFSASATSATPSASAPNSRPSARSWQRRGRRRRPRSERPAASAGDEHRHER
jgi:hypothetical protein